MQLRVLQWGLGTEGGKLRKVLGVAGGGQVYVGRSISPTRGWGVWQLNKQTRLAHRREISAGLLSLDTHRGWVGEYKIHSNRVEMGLQQKSQIAEGFYKPNEGLVELQQQRERKNPPQMN